MQNLTPTSVIRGVCALIVAVSASECALAQALTVTLEHFGVGDHIRPGDLIGIRLAVSAEVDAATTADVVWELPDGNGDIAQVSRRTVLSPGDPERVWLYARVPPRNPASSVVTDVTTVQVFEVREGRRVRSMGAVRISPESSANATVAVDIEDDMIGVVGSGRMGLDVFATPLAGHRTIPAMNALTVVARGLSPADFPDSWRGLSPFETIVWAQENPQALTGDAANALREWIFRGGNFVIVLPETADPWGVVSPATHPLSDLMPKWSVRREGAVPVRTLLPILSKTSELLNSSAAIPLVIFESPGTDAAYEPLIALPTHRDARTGLPAPRNDSLEGATIAVTRTYGHGRVTVLGIDVDGLQKRALQRGGLPQGDIFWNRILARRADTPSAADYKELADFKPSRLFVGSAINDDTGSGEMVTSQIGMRGEAVLGILGAFGLFLVYWLVAGPGGYALLSWRRLQHHSWLAFSLAALVFGTGVWAIGGAMTSTNVRARHLTVIDSIRRGAGGERKDERVLERAVCWFSAYIPGYGEATVEVSSSNTERNALTSWSPPPAGSGGEFPNPAVARTQVSDPAKVTIAARATSASFQADWIGSVPSTWGRLPYASDPNRQLKQSVIAGDPVRVQLSGVIEHRLPAPLRNVHIIHVSPLRNQLPTRRRGALPINEPSDALPNSGRFAVIAEWAPGTPLEVASSLYPGGALDSLEEGGSLAAGIRARYYDPFIGDTLGLRVGTMMTMDRAERGLNMLGIYSMLQPPQYEVELGTTPEAFRVQRMLGRQLDLSPWFTRPCLIVWGFLDTAECPVPLVLDGERIPSDGLTVVRCIFPLPLEEEWVAPESR